MLTWHRRFVLALLGVSLGGFAGSNFSLTALEVGGRYVPEPLFALWFLVLCWLWPEGRNGFSAVVRNKLCLLGFGIIAFGALVGVLNGQGIQAIYGDARASTLLIIFVALGMYPWARRVEWEWVMLCTFLTACVLDVVRPTVYDLYLTSGSIKTSMSFWAAIGIAVVGMRWRSVSLFVIALSFSVYFAKVGFFRLYYFGPICIVALMFAVALTHLNRGWRGARFALILSVVTVGAVAYGYKNFHAFVADISSTVSGRMHSVDRTTQFIEGFKTGDLSAESERVESLKIVLLRPWLVAVPYGTGWRDCLPEVNARFGALPVISTMDSGPLYLGFHYGILAFYISVVLVVVYIGRLCSNHRFSPDLLGALVVLIVVVVNVVSEAGMFTIVPRAIQFGTVIGLLLPVIGSPLATTMRHPSNK
jgi:hypothetical protein